MKSCLSAGCTQSRRQNTQICVTIAWHSTIRLLMFRGILFPNWIKNNRYIFVLGLRLSVYVKLMRNSCSLPLHEVDVSDFDFNGGRCPWTCHVATCKMSDCANNATQLFPKDQKWIGYLRDSMTSLHSSFPTLVHVLVILGMKPSGLQEKHRSDFEEET